MESQLRSLELHHVSLLRSMSGLPTGESINAPLLEPALQSRVTAAQGRLLALLRALGDAAEPGRGTGASITAGLQPGMPFRSASGAPLGAMEELLDRLREVAETALDDVSSGGGGAPAAASAGAAPPPPRAHHPVSLVGVEKPQVRFADAVDNSRDTEFVPRVAPRYAPPPASVAAVEAEGAAAAAEAQLPVLRITPPPGALKAHPFAASALCLAYPEGSLAPPAAGPRAFPPLASAECTWVDTPGALEAMLAYMEGTAGSGEDSTEDDDGTEDGEDAGAAAGGGGGRAGGPHRLPRDGAGRAPVREVAIDLEHHSHRSFQGFTCLVQLSTWERDFLVDALALRSQLHGLNRLTLDPRVVKVLHGCDSDVVWLQRDFGVYLLNVFDTGQAARLLAYPSLGLAYLLKRHAGVTANKAMQLEDWRVRPLPPAMLQYAREDTHWLLGVYDRLKVELVTASVGATLVRCDARAPFWRPVPSLLASALARSAEKTLAVYVKEPFHVDGYAWLMGRMAGGGGGGGGGGAPSPLPSPVAASPFTRVFSALYEWRDRVAREEDESTGFVLPNKLLGRLAETRPATVDALLRACQPLPALVRRDMAALLALIAAAAEGRVSGGGGGGGGGGVGASAPAAAHQNAAAAPPLQRPPAAAAARPPPAAGTPQAAAENLKPPSLTEILRVAEPPGGWLQPPAAATHVSVRVLSGGGGGGGTPPPFSAAAAWRGGGASAGASAAAEVHASLLALTWHELLGVRIWRKETAEGGASAPPISATTGAEVPAAPLQQADGGAIIDGMLRLPGEDLASLLGAAVAGAPAPPTPAPVGSDAPVRSLAQRFAKPREGGGKVGGEKASLRSAPPVAPAFAYGAPESAGLEAPIAPGEAVGAAREAASAAWEDVSRRGAKTSRGGRGGSGGGGGGGAYNPFVVGGSSAKRGRGAKR